MKNFAKIIGFVKLYLLYFFIPLPPESTVKGEISAEIKSSKVRQTFNLKN